MVMNDTELEQQVKDAIWSPTGKYAKYVDASVNRILALIKQRETRLIAEARIDGMQQAKSRVLRRTEIPADAKNPTRDYVVILGEQIAQFIDDDISTLKQESEDTHD